jgi:hypothetical protein
MDRVAFLIDDFHPPCDGDDYHAGSNAKDQDERRIMAREEQPDHKKNSA